MPWFQISDYQRVKMEWLVEAGDAEAARQQFLDSSTPIFIVTQSVEDSDGVSVEAWDGPAPAPGLAGHVTDAASDLLASLRAILPYAESRAEDMAEEAEGLAEDAENFDIDDKAGLAKVRDRRDQSRAYADKAVAAVDAAKALLASLDAA